MEHAPTLFVHTHTHTPKLCSSLLASSSPRLYFNLHERSSQRSQQGMLELRLQRQNAHEHVKLQGRTGSTVQNEEQGNVEVGRISILNEAMVGEKKKKTKKKRTV